MMVTDRRRHHGDDGMRDDVVVATASRAARAGVDMVQIREREIDDRQLFGLVRRVAESVRGTGARLLVNERVDVALAAGADGVHLPAAAISPPAVRRIVPNTFLIGGSVHSEPEAAAVEAGGGCDYLLFGTVFPTDSKPEGHVVAGVAALQRVCARVRLPVLAIGGIAEGRVSEVARAGAAGLAAIGLFAELGDLDEVVRRVRAEFISARVDARGR
jgi:thiamine-phosphate pyrophosphorylase